jgi:hypothetical protein
VRNRELQRELARIAPPNELDAQRRSWPVIREAFEAREPVAWPRRHPRPLIAAAAAVVLLAAALSPPGRALVSDVRDAIGREQIATPKPVLSSLPARGVLLVDAPTGPWIVRPDGSKRLLGRYEEASWSPHAQYVVVSRRRELRALDPKGVVRWSLGREGPISGARWSPEPAGRPRDTRIAYLDDRSLRVVAGDGTDDALLLPRVAPTAPAWRPGADHELAFVSARGRVALVQTDSGETRWRTRIGEPPRQLAWSDDGQRLLALGERVLRVFDGDGRQLWATRVPLGPSGVAFERRNHRFVLIRWVPETGRSELVLFEAEDEPGEERTLFSAAGNFGGLAVSPNGRWLLVGWVNADQWLFLRLDRLRVRAISGVAEQFGSSAVQGPLSSVFPSAVSWCCPPSP